MQLSFAQLVRGRWLARGTLRLAGAPGANAIGFVGRVGGRTLAPGRYRLRVTATAAGRTSRPVALRFAIVR